MPWSATISSTHEPSTRTRTCTLEPGSLYLTAFSTRLPSADCELAAVAPDAYPVGKLEHLDGDVPHLTEVADPVHRSFDDDADVDELGRRLLAELDPRQLEEVVDRPRHAVRLVEHAIGDAVHDVEVVLLAERLGEHGHRPDRRLQLVADVGHEVRPHGVDPSTLTDVLDRRHRATALERCGGDDDGEARRTVQLERLLRLLAVARLGELTVDRLVDEQADVRPGHRLGRAVAVVDLTGRAGDDHAQGEPVDDVGPARRRGDRLLGLGRWRRDGGPPMGEPPAGDGAHHEGRERDGGDHSRSLAAARLAKGCVRSGIQPVTRKRTRSPMLTAWSPMRS